MSEDFIYQLSFCRFRFSPRWWSITETSIRPWKPATQSYDDSYWK